MKAKYAYSADGVKLSVSDGANGYDYLGSLIYVRTNGSLSLERALFDGGALRPNGAVDYFVKDHLGSVRVIVDQAGTVREQNDYYPFGERCPESTYAISAVNRYKYNGKEEQTVGDLGMLDYGARMYRPGSAGGSFRTRWQRNTIRSARMLIAEIIRSGLSIRTA